jgi:hypothetical protein
MKRGIEGYIQINIKIAESDILKDGGEREIKDGDDKWECV